jgi:hypothetical protein
MAVGMPRICLYLDRSRVFRWHLWLAEALAAIPGYDILIGFAPDNHPVPSYCFVLFGLERFIYRMRGNTAINIVDELKPTPDREAVDTVIDFSMTNHPLPDCRRILTPYFNGMPGEIGAIASLFADEPLSVQIDDNNNFFWTASPASTDRQIFIRSLDNLLSCTVGMIIKALRDPLPHRSFCPASVSRPPLWAVIKKVSATVIGKVAKRINKIISGGTDWAVAWRISPTSLLETRIAEFAVLPADRGRYYADPFPVRHRGEDFIFMEDFCYDSGLGRIVVTKITGNGPTQALVVFDEPYHLSYPFIFEEDGEIWMIPETGALRGVDLYRSVKFPDVWKREGRLLDNVEGYDATMARHAGRLWMFVCERMWNSSACDALSLFSSDRLAGPWRPHPNNPILFDSMLCRPGGAAFVHKGYRMRPVQDCSRIYGGRLSLCSVDSIEDSKFSQTVRGRIHIGSLGCHTYNNYAGLEVIDFIGRRRDTVTAYFRGKE